MAHQVKIFRPGRNGVLKLKRIVSNDELWKREEFKYAGIRAKMPTCKNCGDLFPGQMGRTACSRYCSDKMKARKKNNKENSAA